MKRYISLLITLAIAFTLCACGEDGFSAAEPTLTTAPTDAPTQPGVCSHNIGVVQTTPASCTEAGLTVSVCSLCGEEFTETVPATGHRFTDATCTSPRSCSACGITEGEPLGHRYASGTCDRCGAKMPGYEDTPTDCAHAFVLSNQTAPTCTKSGSLTYICSKCADTYTEELAATGHSYTAATCNEPKTCRSCKMTDGTALGHSYSNGVCVRCGKADPSASKDVTCSVTIRSDKGKVIPGVTVQIFADENTLFATGKTGSNGNVSLTVPQSAHYKIVLSDIPEGLSAKESYTFRSTTININLTTLSVITPTDHSKANYKVGSVMGDFTLTDTDGNAYTLSSLLQSKKLVILNFWFVNCGPCKAEFPYFEAISKEYADVQLLTMNHIDSEKDILALRQQMGVTFPMIQEDIGFQEGFGITAYPTTVFIDSTGRILKIQVGDFKNQSELEELIEQFI